MKSIYKFFKEKLLFFLGIIILLLGLFSLLLHKLEKLANVSFYNSVFGENEVVKNNETVLDATGSILTDTQARFITERIYNSMRFRGTDEKELFYQLNSLGDSEFNHIYNLFGLRYYSVFWGTDASDKYGSSLDLINWLRQELSDSDFNKLRLKFESIF